MHAPTGSFFPLLFFEIGAVAIGIARGALDLYEDVLRNKRTDVPPFTSRSEQVGYQHHFGQAIGLVDLAEAALLEGADRYLAQAQRAVEEARRMLLLAQQCVRLARDAVDLLFRTSGTSGGQAGSELSNSMLAMTVMRAHMSLQWDRTMENDARIKLGLPAGFL